MKLADHREKMNHGFVRIKLDLEKYGYRLDDKNSIKMKCGLDRLKAADYIEPKGDKFAFVEFTDLRRQLNNTIKEFLVIKEATFPDRSGKKISHSHCDRIIGTITSEFCTKFKDSLFILAEIKKIFTDIPDSFEKKPHAVLVIAPQHHDDKHMDTADAARYFDSIKNAITLGLPEMLFTQVHIIELNDYASS
ncbi:hypothetical protein ACFPAG_16435 [Vogesella sp. GCM10023246]|uniref:Uncharacterized protein n=1 Tax=Vogesella oryzagri TaxID=3160864 RepID=A0ABV1MA15_9NEIS